MFSLVRNLSPLGIAPLPRVWGWCGSTAGEVLLEAPSPACSASHSAPCRGAWEGPCHLADPFGRALTTARASSPLRSCGNAPVHRCTLPSPPILPFLGCDQCLKVLGSCCRTGSPSPVCPLSTFRSLLLLCSLREDHRGQGSPGLQQAPLCVHMCAQRASLSRGLPLCGSLHVSPVHRSPSQRLQAFPGSFPPTLSPGACSPHPDPA